MIRYRLLSVLLLLVSVAGYGATVDSLLTQLDWIMRNRSIYERQKQDSIIRIKRDFESCTTAADRYNTLRALYQEYRTYRIDSAMIIADQRLDAARELCDKTKIASATLNLAESYAKAGMPDKAIAILDTLSNSYLADYHLKYRTNIYRMAYSAKGAAAILGNERMEALHNVRKYTDEALGNSASGSRGSYTLRAEELKNAGLYHEAVALIEEASRNFDFTDDAAMQYTMGEIYHAAGEDQKAVECLTRAAIIDISNGIKEYNSLILLSSILFQQGDVDRAFEYINCAFEDADFSHAALHTSEIMKCMPMIDEAFHNAQNLIRIRTEKMLVVTGLMSLLLLASLVMLYRQYRQNRVILSKVEDMNAELIAKNNQLTEADNLKLRHINMLMLAQAGNISRLKAFRKNIYRLMKSSQYNKVLDELNSDKVEAIEIASFYKQFDEAFLSIFPDFIAESAAFFDKPVKIKTPGSLTPELRVAAMMRLGMTTTDEIASILHYTPQTVYNLRSSLKSMINVPWEEFTAYLSKR